MTGFIHNAATPTREPFFEVECEHGVTRTDAVATGANDIQLILPLLESGTRHGANVGGMNPLVSEMVEFVELVRGSPFLCTARRVQPLLRCVAAACVDCVLNEDYINARKLWRIRSLLKLAVELKTPEAVRHNLLFSTEPNPTMSRLVSAMNETLEPVGMCRVVHEAVPCDCLRNTLAAYQDAVPTPGRSTDSVPEQPSPNSNATSNHAVYLSLPVRDLVGHVEVRAMAPPNDASTREVLFCRPDSRHVYTHFGIRSEDVADGDTWATSLVSNMQRSLAMGGHRLRRITVRDAVVARALRRVGGMECPGTVIQVGIHALSHPPKHSAYPRMP